MLTRLNNQPLVVNADLIKFIEQAPDTVITLVTGEKLVVRESAEEVIRRVIGFRRELLADLQEARRFEVSAPSQIGEARNGEPVVDKASVSGMLVGFGGIPPGC